MRAIAAHLPWRRQVPHQLRMNLSFVLHERSTSRAVAQWARRCTTNSARAARIAHAANPVGVVGELPTTLPRVVLTAHLGAWETLPFALSRIAKSEPVRLALIDDGADDGVEFEFFRAPARLSCVAELHEDVIVAALPLRPGGRTTMLHVAGVFRLPCERDAALSAIESLICAYADQWFPPAALWDAPAEDTLRHEVR